MRSVLAPLVADVGTVVTPTCRDSAVWQGLGCQHHIPSKKAYLTQLGLRRKLEHATLKRHHEGCGQTPDTPNSLRCGGVEGPSPSAVNQAHLQLPVVQLLPVPRTILDLGRAAPRTAPVTTKRADGCARSQEKHPRKIQFSLA